MNSYPDPTQTTVEPLPFGEPEYREYPPAPPQPRGPVYPSGPAFPPGYRPVAGGPTPSFRPVQPVPYAAPPYPYAPNGQVFRPSTSQPVPPFPVAKKGSRGWIIVLSTIGIAILILVSVLIFAFSRVSSSNTNPSASLSGTTISRPGLVNLGQSITIDSLTATALSVSPLKSAGTTDPKPGNEYVVVNMRLQNNTNASQYYTPDDFHVFNGDNQESDVEVIVPDTYTADQQLLEGSLDAYGSIEGDLIIQVPMNDHNVKLGWSPGTVSSDSEYEWKLAL